MATAEMSATLVAPPLQATRTTSTGAGARPSGLGAPGPDSFVALVNGIAESSQATDDVPPADPAQSQTSERCQQVDRSRAKPVSNGRAAAGPSVRREEAAAEQTDAADPAAGARGPQRSKPAGALSGNSLAPEAASDEYAGEPVVANSQTPQIPQLLQILPQVLQIPQSPQIVPRACAGKALREDALAALAPAIPSSAGLPAGVPAQADGPSSTGTIAAIGSDAQSVDANAVAAASVDTILEAVGSTHSTDVGVSVARNAEVSLLGGASRTANTSAATGRGSVQGRHGSVPGQGDVRGIALSAVRNALALSVRSQQPADGSDAGSTRIDSLPTSAAASAHDVPAALAAYSLVGSSGVDATPEPKVAVSQATGVGAIPVSKIAVSPSTGANATLVEKGVSSQSTDDASIHEGLERRQTELMPTDDQSPRAIIPAEIRSMPLRSWVAPATTMDRSALAGAIIPTPVVEPAPNGITTHVEPGPNVVDTKAPSSSVTAVREIVAVAATPQRTARVTTPDGVTSARRTGGTQGESSSGDGAAMPSQVPQATADLVRAASAQVASEAPEAVDAFGEKRQAATLPMSIDVPVRDAPRVASLRRPQTGTGSHVSPPSAPVESTVREQGPTRQVAAISPVDRVQESAAAPSRPTRQSAAPSAPNARDPHQWDPLAVQNLAVASTTATSTANPARKIEVAREASPRPTGTAAIAIAAFQAAALPDLHRSASSGGASVMSAALLDAQVRTPIVNAIKVQADNGNGQVRLRLNPEFLGEVSVDVRVNGGSVVASVQASSADVREWLRTNEAMLRQTLADQGLHLERLVIGEEEAQPGKEPPDHQQRDGSSDRQREWERRSRRPRDTGTFEVVL